MSEVQQQTGLYSFEVEPFQEDYTGHLSWGVLGNHLLKCASFHANAHGFGVMHLNESDYSWVLSRMVIEMKELPTTGERYTIETWISSVYRLFTDRCFEIKKADGTVLGYAYTIWAMINMETRQPADLSLIVNDEFRACILPEKPCPVKKPAAIRVKNATPVRTVQTYYSDIDINNHVNSIRYIEHTLDLFPKDVYAHRHVSRIETAFNEETYCGETLTFCLEEKGDDTFAVEIHKNTEAGIGVNKQSVVCRCAITFTDADNKE